MFGSLRVCSILMLALAFAHVDLAQADPTIDEVYRQAHSGHLAKAQEMMREVLRDHPDSAKAHFVMADLLAASGDRALAAEHLATARRLAPGLPFATSASVHELEQRLDGGENAGEGADAENRPIWSFGWGSGVALIVGLALIAFVFRRRPLPMAGTTSSASAPSAAPSAPNATSTVAPPSTGSGLGSAVATGLATGAGVVAGEAIAHRLLRPDQPATTAAPDPTQAPAPTVENDDLGGNDFGISEPDSWDDNSSNDDTDDPIGGDDDWN